MTMLEAEKRAQIARKYAYSPKQSVRPQRVDGKRMIFYVFQAYFIIETFLNNLLIKKSSNNVGLYMKNVNKFYLFTIKNRHTAVFFFPKSQFIDHLQSTP